MESFDTEMNPVPSHREFKLGGMKFLLTHEAVYEIWKQKFRVIMHRTNAVVSDKVVRVSLSSFNSYKKHAYYFNNISTLWIDSTLTRL